MQPKRAYVHFNRRLAPVGFLIVPEGVEPDDENQTILIQSEDGFGGVARSMGWNPLQYLPNGYRLMTAREYLQLHADEEFEALADYLPSPGESQ